MAGVDNRQVKLSRGRFLGGCSGCNGTLCVRGCKQDYDDWGLEGWTGEEFFKYMRKVRALYGLLSIMIEVDVSRPKPSIQSPGSKRTRKATATRARFIRSHMILRLSRSY